MSYRLHAVPAGWPATAPLTWWLAKLATEGVDVDAARAHVERVGIAALPIKWNARMKTRAGVCSFKHNGTRYVPRDIALNPRLWSEGFDAVRETFLHELAHALCPVEWRHDARWRAVARAIGSTGSRCHAYATMQAERKPIATCEKCGATVGRVRISESMRARFAAGQRRHVGCNGIFRLIDGGSES